MLDTLQETIAFSFKALSFMFHAMGEKLDLFMGEGKEPNCENDKWTSGENNVSPIREIIDVNFVPFIGVAVSFVLAFLLQSGAAVKWQRIFSICSKFPALWEQKMLASKFVASK